MTTDRQPEPLLDYRGAPPPHYELRLSAALREVLRIHDPDHNKSTPDGKSLTLGLIVEVAGDRAFGVLMAFLCLPFLTPIPIPGLSIPFGIALMLLGAQLAVRKHRPWLPQRMMRLHLPPKFGPRLIAFVARIFRPLEKIIRPRLLLMQNHVAMVLVGLALVADGFLLSLPLPPVIPFSNALPAWMALVKILGITEEDGVSLLVGTVMTAIAVAGTIILVIMSWASIEKLWH